MSLHMFPHDKRFLYTQIAPLNILIKFYYKMYRLDKEDIFDM